MKCPAVLLRVLLVLALVLNGIGAAVASVHAPADHADRDLVQAIAADAGAPCHESAPAPSPLHSANTSAIAAARADASSGARTPQVR